MPRIPDIQDLGARPTPRFQRSVATVRNRSAVADAAGQFGAGVADIAGKAIEKEDRLLYSRAKAELLKADAAARSELADDPDYETYEQRYTERMAKARQAASGLIKSRSDRGLFDADVSVDIERGMGQVRETARGKRVLAGKATLIDTLDGLQDVGQDAADDATREASLTTASDAIRGALEQGFISPVEAVELSRSHAQGYVKQQFAARLNRDDLDGAERWLNANRGRLDFNDEMALENQLTGVKDRRQSFGDAADALAALTPAQPQSGPTTKPVQFASMVAITAQTESGNRDFRADGSYVTSPKGARGRMQVMPGTQRDPGFGVKPAANDSPAELARVGEEYLAAMMRRYGNDPAKAWAAYNAGPGAVDKALAKGGDWLSALPGETQAYVRKNVKAAGGSTAAGAVTDVPDIGQAYAWIERQDWSPERKERAKEQVSVDVNRARVVENQRRDEAYERVYAKAESLGEGLTDRSQLGPDFWAMSPEQRGSVDNMIEANLKAAKGTGVVDPDGLRANDLDLMAIDEPERFADPRHDLRRYAGQIKPGDLNRLKIKQAKMREGDDDTKTKDERMRSGITGAINWMNDYGGVTIAARDKVRAYNFMESYLKDVAGKKGSLSQADFTESARLAVKVDAGTGDRYYQVLTDVPKSFRDDIIRTWPGPRAPTESEIVTAWRRRVNAKTGR